MSHYRLKTKYNTEGSYGSVDTKTLYAHHNLSCDIVSFYDEDGDCIISVEDTLENNLLNAINRLYAPFKENMRDYVDEVEPMTKEEREMISNRYKNTTMEIACKFLEWTEENMWSHYENTPEGLKRTDKWYNSHNYEAMEKSLTTEELFRKFLSTDKTT